MSTLDMNMAFIDCETTGLKSDKHEIIEIAAIIYDHNKDIIIKEWEAKAKPINLETAEQVALDMNGYNLAPETYNRDIMEVMSEFYEITKDCLMFGQNIAFDIKFIEKYYEKLGHNEIHRHAKLELSSLAWPIRKKFGLRGSLEAICNHFNISNDGSHRALIDCRRTLECYRCIMKTLTL